MNRALVAFALAGCGRSGHGGHGAMKPVANIHAAPECTLVTYSQSGDPFDRIVIHGDQLVAFAPPKTIRIYPLAGGAPKVLEQEETVGDIAVVGDKLITTHYEGGGLVETPLAGGIPRSISEAMDGPHQISPLGHGHYIVVGLTGVYRAKPDGRVETLYASSDSDTDIGASAVPHDSHAYMLYGGAIFELGMTGPGNRIYVPSDGNVPKRIAVGTHSLFVELASEMHSIWEIDLATHETRMLTRYADDELGEYYPGESVTLLASNGDLVYAVFANNVKRIDPDGTFTTVFRAPNAIRELVVDGDALYYATDSGIVARTCLPHP